MKDKEAIIEGLIANLPIEDQKVVRASVSYGALKRTGSRYQAGVELMITLGDNKAKHWIYVDEETADILCPAE